MNNKLIQMPKNIPILGQQTRQQQRDEARKAAADIGPFIKDTKRIIGQLIQEVNNLHTRVNVAFESMRIMGATEELFDQAEKDVPARLAEMREKEEAAAKRAVEETQGKVEDDTTQEPA